LQKEEVKQDAALLNPQERVAAVRPMWEQRGHSDRVELLTVELSSLKQQAQQQADKARASAGAHMVESTVAQQVFRVAGPHRTALWCQPKAQHSPVADWLLNPCPLHSKGPGAVFACTRISQQ
jgi:hypothetical protein